MFDIFLVCADVVPFEPALHAGASPLPIGERSGRQTLAEQAVGVAFAAEGSESVG